MDARRIKEEMQFITNIMTNDIDYLMYLLIKDSRNKTEVKDEPNSEDEGYLDSSKLDDWFDNL